jgi:hypothetical protein
MTQSTDSTTPSLNHPLITATLPTGAGIYRLTSKFLSFAPAFSFARNHLGCAPRPAQVLPCLSRYLTGAFRPLSGLPPPLPDSLEPLPDSLESSFRSWAALLLKVFSISARSFNNASTDIPVRLGAFGISSSWQPEILYNRIRSIRMPLYWLCYPHDNQISVVIEPAHHLFMPG